MADEKTRKINSEESKNVSGGFSYEFSTRANGSGQYGGYKFSDNEKKALTDASYSFKLYQENEYASGEPGTVKSVFTPDGWEISPREIAEKFSVDANGEISSLV